MKTKLTPAEKAHIALIELRESLDKRTKEHRKAAEAERLIIEIRRAEHTPHD
jgi:hypothetical protein